MDLDVANGLISIQPTTCMGFDNAFRPKDIWKTKFDHHEDLKTMLGVYNCLGESNSRKGVFVMFQIYLHSFFLLVKTHGVDLRLNASP